MKTRRGALGACFAALLAVLACAGHTVYPAGTTMYQPDKGWNGFTIFSARVTGEATLIGEGANGRIFEVTPEHEIVWEYVSPFFPDPEETQNGVYRAYRVHYDWVPQAGKPIEKAVTPVPKSRMRVTTQ